MLDVEQAAEGGPQGGGELGPSLKQSIRAIYC